MSECYYDPQSSGKSEFLGKWVGSFFEIIKVGRMWRFGKKGNIWEMFGIPWIRKFNFEPFTFVLICYCSKPPISESAQTDDNLEYLHSWRAIVEQVSLRGQCSIKFEAEDSGIRKRILLTPMDTSIRNIIPITQVVLKVREIVKGDLPYEY